MTDKRIIETFKNIKDYCDSQPINCIGCRFQIYYEEEMTCQILALMHEFETTPCGWEIEKIERIINETD